MGELLIILKIGIVIISFIAWLSFRSGKNNAKAQLDHLGDAIKPLRTLTDEESEALASKFEFSPTNHDVYEFTGPIEGESLSTNGSVTDTYYSIAGFLVSIPESALPYLQPGDNVAEVAHENDSTWLISLNNAWHISADVAEHQTRDLNSEKIEQAALGKLKDSDIEIVGKRDATAKEILMLMPYSYGIGSMLSLLLICGLFAILVNFFEPAIAVGISLLLLPLSYWLLARIRRSHPNQLSITKMNGQIHEVETFDKGIMVHFQPPQLTMATSYSYIAPLSWEGQLPRDGFVNFEVSPKSDLLVSLGNNLSIANNPMKPQIARHVSMLAGVLVFLGVLYYSVNIPIFKASIAHLWHERQVTAADASSLNDQGVGIGDALVLSGHRQCLSVADSWNVASYFCQQFYYLDQAPASNPMTPALVAINQFLTQYQTVDITPQVSDALYSRLQLMFLYSQDTLAPQREIMGFSADFFPSMVALVEPVCEYSTYCADFKEEAALLWQDYLADVGEPQSCETAACWQQMQQDNPLEDVYVQHVRKLQGFYQALNKLHQDLGQQLLKQQFERPTPSPLLLVELTSNTQIPEQAGELYAQLLRDMDSNDLNAFKTSLADAEQFDALKGIVLAVTQTEQGQKLLLNTDLTKQDLLQQLFILALLLVLIGLALMHLIRIVWLKFLQPTH
ncbi:IgaA/UmoB family intracellular growth attenuator [Motilimonas cestriensis]|uniref:IgaA/UmoB family intracellular growth attenuator n=1 Tax=Motilimonas cestriensis TaxID=2742685 RepID=UPI003DA51BC2